MLPDSILPTSEDDIARILANFERRLSHLERLEPLDIGARVFNSTPITIVGNGFVTLTFDSERFDTDGIHSTVANTDRLTATTGGTYLIAGNAQWAAPPGNGQMRILFNGVTELADTLVIGADYRAMALSTLYQLAATDYVLLQVAKGAAGDIDIAFQTDYSPSFMMARVG